MRRARAFRLLRLSEIGQHGHQPPWEASPKALTTEQIGAGAPWLVLLLLVVFVVHLSSKKAPKNQRKEQLPPLAPTTLWETITALARPAVGIWFLLRMARAVNHQSVFRLPFFLGSSIYIVGDPSVARRLLQDTTTDKPRALYGVFDRIFGGPSVFTSRTNAFWKMHRAAMAPAFSKNEVRRMTDVCQTMVDEWCRTVLDPMAAKAAAARQNKNDLSTTTTFDPYHEMCCLTIRVIAQAAFEYPITKEETLQYLQDLNTCMQEYMVKQLYNPLRNYCGWILPEVQQARESALRIRALAQRMLDHHRQQQQQQQQQQQPERTNDDKAGATDSSLFPKTLIRLIDSHPGFSERDKVVEIGTTMVAGFDTTGTFLGNTLNHLAGHPETVQALRADLERVDNNPAQSPYLQYVIKESYRLTPVIALGAARRTTVTTTTTTTTTREFSYDDGDDEPQRHNQQSQGSVLAMDDNPTTTTTVSKPVGSTCTIPKGATVFLPHILPLHNAYIFPNPNSFDPLRWAHPTPEMTKAITVMFSLGQRKCLGQALATAEISTVLPRLIQQYDLVQVQPARPDCSLALRLVNGKIQPQRRGAAV